MFVALLVFYKIRSFYSLSVVFAAPGLVMSLARPPPQLGARSAMPGRSIAVPLLRAISSP